jgi:hypothetical protein
LLTILEKKDAEQLQVFKAECDKAVVAENKAIQEMEIKSLEAEKARLEEKKKAKQSCSKSKKAMHTVSATEKKYQKLMEKVAKIQETVEKVRNIASATFKIPDFKFGAVTNAFGGPRFDMESAGGTKLAENLVSAAESYAARFAQRQLDAAKTKLQAELERRKKEWLLEDEVADAEVVEVEKQEIINEIKTQQVERKYQNIEKEILRSEEIYEVLSEKFTNKQLYKHLEEDLGKTFKHYVNLLLEVAKMAEKAYHFEIDGEIKQIPEYMCGNYWENMYKGLLAPEKILLDLRRMEKAYLEKDEHELKITRPILLISDLSNVQNYEGPLSLTINSKTDSVLDFNIVIASNFFGADFNDVSNRRIKDVKLQVVIKDDSDNYNCLNAEVSLTSEKIFLNSWATSMAMSEMGKYDFDFFDEKYSPFEGCSLDKDTQWNIRLSGLGCIENKSNVKVVLFVSYVARKGND